VDLYADLEYCNLEIARCLRDCMASVDPKGAYLGLHDWTTERRLIMAEIAKQEAVNHPPHYGGDTTYEAIKVIEAWQLGFCLGNAVKYICRATFKGNTLEDLRKARWYLDRKIAALEANERTTHPDPQIASLQTPKDEKP
jgi:hypothetical protein